MLKLGCSNKTIAGLQDDKLEQRVQEALKPHLHTLMRRETITLSKLVKREWEASSNKTKVEGTGWSVFVDWANATNIQWP